MQDIINVLFTWLPFSITLFLGVIILYILQKLFFKWAQREVDHSKIYYQLTLFFIFNLVIVMAIISSPISDSIKGQLLSLLGILYTAAIALSSTTFLGNILGGLMVKVLGKLRPGDFVHIENNFGRITELGILHTEIQTIDRDLTTLPNLYLVTNPVKVIRSSGTIISEDISLGYDIHHNKIERYLIQAAENCKLEEPFMHIQKLGDFSVTYRISGVLKDIRSLLTTKAKLREEILDALHDAGIEIVSPTFMNQRMQQAGVQFIPKREKEVVPQNEELPEEIIFDKADEAESIDNLKMMLAKLDEQLASLIKDISIDKDDKEKSLQRLNSHKEHILALIAKKQEEKDND